MRNAAFEAELEVSKKMVKYLTEGKGQCNVVQF